jgi:photosystem II stability/assembly factor-like uncharacterized protein
MPGPLRAVAIAFSLAVCPALASTTALQAQTPILTVQQSGTLALLQAVSVSALHPKIVWISGHAGTWAKSTDGGATWQTHVMPDQDSLQFRDVHALDAERAWLLAAGPGAKSGIFHTLDGGVSWTRVFANADTSAFFDCMAFIDDDEGFAFSDAVNGRTPIVHTVNGMDWTLMSIPSLPGEGGFAASGTCAQALPTGDAWMATGSTATPRIRHSADRGRTWTDAVVPLVGGPAAGATGVAFRDARHGIAVGGVISGSASGPRAARTTDGGRTWTVLTEPTFAGAIYGVAYARVKGKPVVVVVGPGGASYSVNDGETWQFLDAAAYWSVGFGPRGTGWLVGPRGRVVRLDWR